MKLFLHLQEQNSHLDQDLKPAEEAHVKTLKKDYENRDSGPKDDPTGN